MTKFTVTLLLLWMFKVNGRSSFQFTNNYFLFIDCGVVGNFTHDYNSQPWLPDSLFIDSGETKQINPEIDSFMNTLRYFTEEDLNCYHLALTNTEKYIFRAGFYYANYDGKSEPPVFDLLLGGQLWETVNSSGPIFHELIYTPKTGNISVCIRGRSRGGTPFISSLEATYLYHDVYENQTLYSKMRSGTAYHLVSRINFGYDQVIEPWAPGFEEMLNRYWLPQQMSGYNYLSFNYTFFDCFNYENFPPNSVFTTAISPENASHSIYVPITFPNPNSQSAYMVLYFYQDLDPLETINASRYMDVYVDGVMRANVAFEEFISGEVVTLYPLVVQGTVNVTVSPATGTVLPPVLSAIEVFVATELAEQDGYGFGYGYKISSSSVAVWIICFFVCFLF